MFWWRLCPVGCVALGLLVLSGCGQQSSVPNRDGAAVIRVEGSDTMVMVAQAWAEEYHKKRPAISVQVLGGGSGVGIASLIDGNCDLADTSRKMTDTELQRVKAKRGTEAKEFVVGYDALAVYVHKDNPLDEITIEQLAEIYGDGGKITKWSQLGAKISGSDEIVRVSRQNSSGTYAYFREAILGPKRDYKLQSIDQSGSKDVVALVSKTPGSIGYSGMGYKTPDVKMLRIAKHPGEASIAPTLENAKKGLYPITRPLQIYTVGEPLGAAKQYLDWIMAAEGQRIVLEEGYIPL
jgi:phosphate transport system substrate-binding protein